MLVLFLTLTLVTSTLADVIGCTGFVRISEPDSKVKIDFSLIKVAIFNIHGSKIDESEVAPKSGYFFLPIDDKGNYVLKAVPPMGWSVTPSEVSVEVDGENDLCSQNKDIIFTFNGFHATGKISSKDKNQGPVGLSVSLYKKGSEETPLQSATTDSAGQFTFQGLMPDQYTVKLDDQTLELFSFEKKVQEFTVKDGSSTIPPFVIIGYDVEGSVVDRQGNPVVGVKVAKTGDDPETTTTDGQGKYRFSNVSRGSYEIAASLDKVTFEPSAVKVTVFDRNVNTDKIVLAGFVVSGSLVWSSNSKTPMEGARVIAKQISADVTTDKQGRFEIKAKEVGKLSLTFEMEGVRFDQVEVEVKPGVELTPIAPKSYRVRGNVEIGSESDIKVELESTDKKKVTESVRNGQFETYLSAGKYTPRILSKGQYNAKQTSVQVTDKPLDNVDFTLARFQVKGNIECGVRKAGCDNVNLILRSKSDRASAFATISTKGGKFEFDSVPPGEYECEIHGEDSEQCWTPHRRVVSVENKNVEGIVFQQIGELVTVSTDYATTLLFQDGAEKDSHSLQIGKNKLCVKNNGKPIKISTEGCLGFAITPKELDLSKEKEVRLVAETFQVSGLIKSPKDIKDLKITFKSDMREGEVVVKSVSRTDEGYKFEFDAKKSEDLTMTPTSKKTFFDPPVLYFTVRDSCEANQIEFQGREGVFLEGSIKPPVEGVLVEVEDGKTSALTEADGTFKLGPFLQVSNPKLSVSKDGFYFKETDKYGIFTSHQLASINLQFVDEKSTPLPEEVVVSVAGGDSGFKSNSQTKDGTVAFTSLQPGEYFIKAHLKEWVFEPKSIIVELESGANVKKTLVGKRVSFSAFGECLYLNGIRATGQVLQAQGVGDKCKDVVEDATVTTAGQFRLRGLRPNCEYELNPAFKANLTLVSGPSTFKVINNDHILYTPVVSLPKVDIFHLSVNLASESSNKIPLTISNSNFSKTFDVYPNRLTVLPPIPLVDNDLYTLAVRTRVLSEFRMHSDSPAFKYFALDLTTEPQAMRQDKGSKAYYVMPFILIVVGGFAYKRFHQQKE